MLTDNPWSRPGRVLVIDVIAFSARAPAGDCETESVVDMLLGIVTGSRFQALKEKEVGLHLT